MTTDTDTKKEVNMWEGAEEVNSSGMSHTKDRPGTYVMELQIDQPLISRGNKWYTKVNQTVLKVLDQAEQGQISVDGINAGGALPVGAQPSFILMDFGNGHHIREIKDIFRAALDLDKEEVDKKYDKRLIKFTIDEGLCDGACVITRVYWKSWAKESEVESLRRAGVTSPEEAAKKGVIKREYRVCKLSTEEITALKTSIF